MNKITIKNVSKSYNKQLIAVNRVSLNIKTNEFVVLTGPSGCGKTTLLRLIAGLETPDSGHILINNTEMSKVKPHLRDVAMVFQDATLYPHLNVYENIALPIRLTHKFNKEEIDQKVRKIAKITGLSQLLKQKARTLSGGQKQRVAIASALVKETGIILFDEPINSLDIPARKEILKAIGKIKKEIKATYLFVTHDIKEAKALADRIVYMDKGKIVRK